MTSELDGAGGVLTREPIRLRIAPTRHLISSALLVAVLCAVAGGALISALWAPDSPVILGFQLGLTVVIAAGLILVIIPLIGAIQASRVKNPADRVEQRTKSARSRQRAAVSMGVAAAVLVVMGVIYFLIVNDASVQKTFLQPDLMILSFPDILAAFGQNVFIALVAQVLVLIWAMVIALLRISKTAAMKPLRSLATLYIDIFRGLPAIIVIYLVGFGLSFTQIPGLSDLSATWYAIIALTLTYGAYTAEVYRSGLESIHPSQVYAARSLGFSYLQTMRVVVVPQGIRRVIPPLMNNFISLQKDTALVGIIGAVDAFNQSQIYAGNHFNLSSVTIVAVFFLIITITQARLLDRYLDRQERKRSGA
jgi:polar amino acid transport system permease protein